MDVLHESYAVAGRAGAAETVSGAEAILDALMDCGVDTIFGYPGGAALPLYDALHGEPRLRHVLVRHEQGRRARGGGLCAQHRHGWAWCSSPRGRAWATPSRGCSMR